MIKEIDLIKKNFIYGKIRYFLDYKDKLMKHFIKCLLFTRYMCLSKNLLIRNKKKNLIIPNQNKVLCARNFFEKNIIFNHLLGIDIFFLTKTGKNIFVSWFDVFGRLKFTKSLMTLKDPQMNITKKQKSFSIYFLLRKLGTTLRNRYRLKNIALLIKGSLGIRRKKSFISGFAHSGLKIKSITDITNIPFNGCRLKKKKRL